VLDPRIYRAGFVPVIAAMVALMFSLERAPEPLEGPISSPVVKGRDSARLARSLASLAPERSPGSPGDRAVADVVREQFGAVTGGEVTSQTFETSYEGETVEAENVVLTLPGRRPETLLVVAGRDSQVGPGATTSASATATLLNLAEILGSSRHERTIALASVSGSGDGADGVGQLVDQLEVEGGIEAAIVVSQPGVERRVPPFVFPGHADDRAAPATLIETADQIATVQFGRTAYTTDPWRELARLALPVGVGIGTALSAEGVDAITVSGSGERPPEPDASRPGDVSSETLAIAGGTALNLLLTLDQPSAKLPAEPTRYLKIGDNLLPGWTLSLLAVALVLPSLLAAVDAWLRDRRRDARTNRRAIPWVLERALLPLAGLLVAYLLGFVGFVDRPGFPYDPGLFGAGGSGLVALAAIALAIALAALLTRPLRTPLDVEPQTLAAAAGIVCALAVLGIWLVNPFLALLLSPTAHVWVLAARAQGPPRPAVIGVVATLALLPTIAAGVEVAGALDLGLSAPWQALLLVESGQLSLPLALLWCLLLGGLIACYAAAGADPGLEPKLDEVPLRGPGGYAGPGSLGGTPSSLSRH
jgi:Peptidase family M28